VVVVLQDNSSSRILYRLQSFNVCVTVNTYYIWTADHLILMTKSGKSQEDVEVKGLKMNTVKTSVMFVL